MSDRLSEATTAPSMDAVAAAAAGQEEDDDDDDLRDGDGQWI